MTRRMEEHDESTDPHHRRAAEPDPRFPAVSF